jgi:hypothetical protein
MLTIHLHLVLQLRMSGPVPLLPLYALMTWTWTTLLSFLSIWINGITELFSYFTKPGTVTWVVVSNHVEVCYVLNIWVWRKWAFPFAELRMMEALPVYETLCFTTFVHLKDAWWTNSKNCWVPFVIILLSGAYGIQLHNLSLLQLCFSDILSPPVSAICW